MKICLTPGLIGWLLLAAPGLADTNQTALLELHVKNVIYVRMTDSLVVILVDKQEKRFLPIWVGMNEAQAIAMEMQKFKPPRPLTHDLIANLVKELDGQIEKLVITETKANTYFANLSISSRGRTKLIDCRPSDGIAVALRAKAPILAAESVMEHALPMPEEDLSDESHGKRVTALSMTVQTLTPDLAEAFDLGKTRGLLVSESQRNELKRGDVIMAVGSTKVETVEEFNAAVERVGPKVQIELKLLRGGKPVTVRVQLAAQDDQHGGLPLKERR
jgi:uncharacterized protein